MVSKKQNLENLWLRIDRFKKSALSGRPLFSLFCLLNSVENTVRRWWITLPVTGFEPQISGVRSDRSTNCATSIARGWPNFRINYSPLLELLDLTRGSRSHSASEHSDVTLLWVVEFESLSELSALAGFTLIGGGGGNASSSASSFAGCGSGPRGPTSMMLL